jgi:hypothetical protein
MPLASTTQTVQTSLNNCQVSTNLNEYWHAGMRYHNKSSNRQFFNSMTPTFMDTYPEYGSASITHAGANNNPLGSYDNGLPNADLPRGAFISTIDIVENPTSGVTGTTATISLTVREPLILSPMFFDEKQIGPGFIGLNNMQITFVFGALSRVWSRPPNGSTGVNSISALTVNLDGISAEFQYLTPDITEQIPRAVTLSYHEIQAYTTVDSKTTASGASRTIPMNSIQLKSIPKALLFYARYQDTALATTTGATPGYTLTDTYARINSITINWNNNSGLLASASAAQLYKIAVRNGVNISWVQWQHFVGGVLMIRPGIDIPLDSLSAPGLNGNFQLTASMDVTNLYPTTQTLQLNCIAINEGTFNTIDASCQTNIGVLSQADIVSARSWPGVSYKAAEHLYGGDFFSSVKDFFSRLGKGAKSAFGLAKKAVPYAREALDFGESIGYKDMGKRREQIDKYEKYLENPIINKYLGAKPKGSGFRGGAMASREEMKSRLDQEDDDGDYRPQKMIGRMESSKKAGRIEINEDYSD